MLLGIMNTQGTVIGIIAAQYHYTNNQVALFGGLFIFGGICGSAVAGTIVEMKKNYKTMLTILAFLSTVALVELMFVMKSLSVWGTAVSCFLVGSVSIAVLPVGVDFAVEISHPVPESISTGLLLSTGQVIGIVLTVCDSLWITKSGNAGVIGGSSIMIVGAAVAGLISLGIESDLRRMKLEQQQKGLLDTEEESLKAEGLII